MQESCQEETGGGNLPPCSSFGFQLDPWGVGRARDQLFTWLSNTDKWPFLFAFADGGPSFGEEGQAQSMQEELGGWKPCQGVSPRDGRDTRSAKACLSSW